MASKAKIPIHASMFAFFLWCNDSALATATGDIWICATSTLQCVYLDFGSGSNEKIQSLHLRGGFCPEEGMESELSTADGPISAVDGTDKDGADSASLRGQNKDAIVVSPRVAVDETESESVDESESAEAETDADAGADLGAHTDADFDINSSGLAATELRLAGKEAHDKGDFELAAELFQKAVDVLVEEETDASSEEHATCRLHQALCYLKSEKFEECLEACSDILESSATYSSAVRARAYHRRAKAKLALDDQAGALMDARSAAFLGDRKAVALYGRLMRETSSSISLPVDSASATATGDFMSAPTSPSAALFESLMSKSSPGDQPGINPATLLFGGEKSSLLNSLGRSGGSGLAKSVISSVAKRLDDENTQASISTFLQNTNKVQLQQFASMAGVEVPETLLDRIERVCHGVTPKTIRRTLKASRGAFYVVRIARRISRLVQKYKSLLVALLLLQWTKSAILRPIPVDRALVKRQAKTLLKDAMRANRAGAK